MKSECGGEGAQAPRATQTARPRLARPPGRRTAPRRSEVTFLSRRDPRASSLEDAEEARMDRPHTYHSPLREHVSTPNSALVTLDVTALPAWRTPKAYVPT